MDKDYGSNLVEWFLIFVGIFGNIFWCFLEGGINIKLCFLLVLN